MKVVAQNFLELPVSIGVWVSGITLGSVAPIDLPHVLILAGSQALAFACALNAVLDFRRFKVFGRIICFAWFSFMLILTPLVLWGLSKTTFFSRM
jgi:hypothetical protein